jgi:hypothetical protein
MTFMKSFLLLFIIVTSSFDVLAVEVYKTVDESGAVVFSDKQTHDAEKIKVQPNVVDLNTPVMPESSSQGKPKKQVSTTSKGSQQEVIGSGTANNGNLRKKNRR